MRDPEALTTLQARLGITFKNPAYLEQALRHRSCCMDRPLESNERLEFLGDSVVGVITCDYLYERFPNESEGYLATAQAFLVSEPSLAEAGLALGLDTAVEMSGAEEVSGGRIRPSIVSDTFEAVIAAIYLDQGIRAARRIVRRALKPAMLRVARDEYQRDFKSLLQERVQAKGGRTPHYKTLSESGLDHDKTFVAQALLGRKVIGEGSGKSKKQAQQSAAQAALDGLS